MRLDRELFLEPGEFGRLNENTAANLDDAQGPGPDLVFKVSDADAQFSGRLAFGEEFGEVSW